MKLLVDYADVDAIREIYNYYPIDGVTTNPSILSKTGQNPYKVLREIKEIVGTSGQLHVQAISRTCDEILEEANFICRELGSNTYIKVPVNREGLKAIAVLSGNGINVTATAVYNKMQAFLGAKAGARYVAPYVNRIDNLGLNGVEIVKDMQDMLFNNELKTEILSASFKNINQIMTLCEYGIGACTVAPELIEKMLQNELVDKAVDDFIADFETLCGNGKTMKTCHEKKYKGNVC